MQIKSIPKELWPFCALICTSILMQICGVRDTLDIRFYYSVAEAKDFFQNLSAEKAQAYLIKEFFDLAFLTIYSFLFFVLLRRFYRVRFSSLAFVPGFLDLIETVSIIAVLTGSWEELPSWLGFVTALKWTTAVLIILVIAMRSFTKVQLLKR